MFPNIRSIVPFGSTTPPQQAEKKREETSRDDDTCILSSRTREEELRQKSPFPGPFHVGSNNKKKAESKAESKAELGQNPKKQTNKKRAKAEPKFARRNLNQTSNNKQASASYCKRSENWVGEMIFFSNLLLPVSDLSRREFKNLG